MSTMYPILRCCRIFDGVPEAKYPNVLHCLHAQRRSFVKEETILNIGEQSDMAGIVLYGIIELIFYDENGNQINVDHISAGEVFGAELACSKKAVSPMRLCAITDCEILFLKFSSLLDVNVSSCPYRQQVTANLLRSFASQTLFLNMKLRIMGQKRLRDKIKVYLQNQKISESGVIHIPFNRQELADFLYVDRSALSREFSRMQSEGILALNGRTIKLLDHSFLSV